jgi:hypothetical protein
MNHTKLTFILLGALLTGSGCSASTTANNSATSTSVQPYEVARVIPQYPLYEVQVRVCGDIIISKNSNGERCAANKLYLWGPVGETRLVQTELDIPLASNLGHRVAVRAKGCYPAYKQPHENQFYWVNMAVRVHKGGKTLVESKKTLLSNEQVHEVVKNRFSGGTIQTFGRLDCQPADVERLMKFHQSRKIKKI